MYEYPNLFKKELPFQDMNKWVEILVGLVLLVGLILLSWSSAVYGWTLFGKDINLLHAGWVFLKGGLFWLVLMIGLLFVLLGINDLRE
jgi:hypothetical protein